MVRAALKPMTPEEFLLWDLTQEDSHEFVDGCPVKMMTGASRVHDTIVVNLIGILRDQLRGSPCRPTTDDIALRTKIRSFRRPDVTVTCDPPKGDVYEALEPRMVVEVLSPSNVGITWDRKMREYRRLEQLDYILICDALIVGAALLTRTQTDWDEADFDRLADAIELPKLGCRLSMAEIYEGTGLVEEAIDSPP
jgi:Uma2 family endonuclease